MGGNWILQLDLTEAIEFNGMLNLTNGTHRSNFQWDEGNWIQLDVKYLLKLTRTVQFRDRALELLSIA